MNKTIVKNSLKATALIISMALAGFMSNDNSVLAQTAKSDLIKIEGASAAQLQKVQSLMYVTAYGTDAKPKPKQDGKASSASARSVETADEDACPSFYMPAPKLRIFKSLPEKDPCADRKTTVLADTDIQVIFLCKDGKTIADYDFSQGRDGVGKTTAKDGKTPLGKYALGNPGASVDGFKVFIPVGYPTLEQKQKGFSGSAIGIHGPYRTFRCAGFLNTAVNWTQGCLAVASDTYIKEIGRFVLENSVKEITILPLMTDTPAK